MFNGYDYAAAGVSAGNTNVQYEDAVMRSQFDQVGKKDGYHLLLGKPTVRIDVPSNQGQIVRRPRLIPEGRVDITWFSSKVQNLMGSASHFVTDIHGLSHEVAEWGDDPFVNNKVDPWVTPTAPQYGCTAYLETGDPVVGIGFHLPKNPDTRPYSDGNWHPEDEVFLPWFAREDPNVTSQTLQSGGGERHTFMGTSTRTPDSSSPRPAATRACPASRRRPGELDLRGGRMSVAATIGCACLPVGGPRVLCLCCRLSAE
jgi:hypothetical protein